MLWEVAVVGGNSERGPRIDFSLDGSFEVGTGRRVTFPRIIHGAETFWRGIDTFMSETLARGEDVHWAVYGCGDDVKATARLSAADRRWYDATESWGAGGRILPPALAAYHAAWASVWAASFSQVLLHSRGRQLEFYFGARGTLHGLCTSDDDPGGRFHDLLIGVMALALGSGENQLDLFKIARAASDTSAALAYELTACRQAPAVFSFGSFENAHRAAAERLYALAEVIIDGADMHRAAAHVPLAEMARLESELRFEATKVSTLLGETATVPPPRQARGRGGRPANVERNNQIIRLAESGMKHTVIASRLNITVSTVEGVVSRSRRRG